MFFDFLLVFVDKENTIGNANHNHNGRNQSSEHCDFKSKKAQYPKGPHDADDDHDHGNKGCSIGSKEEKENQSRYQCRNNNKHPNLTQNGKGIDCPNIGHPRNVNVQSRCCFKGTDFGQEFIIDKKLSLFGVDNFFFEGDDCQIYFCIRVEKNPMKKG